MLLAGATASHKCSLCELGTYLTALGLPLVTVNIIGFKLPSFFSDQILNYFESFVVHYTACCNSPNTSNYDAKPTYPPLHKTHQPLHKHKEQRYNPQNRSTKVYTNSALMFVRWKHMQQT